MESNCRYYGSDFNRFIGQNCPRNFTTINIDCFQLKWETKRIRFIEAKHTSEKVGKEQFRALKFIADNLKPPNGWRCDVCVVYGNEPFDNLSIHDLVNNEMFYITGQENVKRWSGL